MLPTVVADVMAIDQGVLRPMRIRQLKTVAALVAIPTSLIGTSIVLVSASSRPVDDPQGTGRATVAATQSVTVRPPGEVTGRHEKKAIVEGQDPASRHRAEQPGTVEPAQRVEVVASVPGRISRLAVDLGTTVRRGDLLAELESPELRLDLARAEAVVRQARARIAAATADVRVEESVVKTTRARMQSAEVAWKAAEAEQTYRRSQHARLLQLIEKGALAPSVRQEEEERLRATDSGVKAARARLFVAQADLETAGVRLSAVMADREEIDEGLHIAEADRDKARLRVDSLRVSSPIDGVVAGRHRDVGDHVRAADGGVSSPIVTIVGMRTVRVVTDVPDRDVPRIDVGAPATFRSEVPGARVFRGKVARIAVAEDPATRAMRAEIDLDNADGALRPGQCGRVQIDLDARPDPHPTPTAAVE